MKRIYIGHGLYARVDDQDHPAMSALSWHPMWGPNTVYAGTNVPSGDGYVSVGMHRLINKTPDGLLTDHVDGDGLNNTRANLRDATQQQNGQNRAPNRGGTSAFKGVHMHRRSGRWRASIRIEGRLTSLGLFADERAAAQAYDRAARAAFGSFCRANFESPA